MIGCMHELVGEHTPEALEATGGVGEELFLEQWIKLGGRSTDEAESVGEEGTLERSEGGSGGEEVVKAGWAHESIQPGGRMGGEPGEPAIEVRWWRGYWALL
jgi:hypothetical protein